MTRRWPLLVALPIALYAAYVWAQILGPVALGAIMILIGATLPPVTWRRR